MTAAQALNTDALFEAAECHAGLHGFADAAMRQRVAALVEAMNAHGRWSEAAIPAARAQVERRIAERLKLERDLRAHPEIAQETIERPLFIVGYGRTGTTILHCLLGEDPDSRMPRFWETDGFTGPPGIDPTQGAEAIARADAECKAWIAAVPNLLPAHPYWDEWAQTPIEDEEIFSCDFHTAYPTHYYRVPFSPLDTAASDPAQGYRFLETFLQYRQWRMPRRHWVCKGVMHLFYLDKLLERFPDALCIWTHRDPVEFVASNLGIYTALFDSVAGPVDRPAHAKKMIESIRGGYDYILAQPWVDDPRVVHVRFRDFLADPVGTVGHIHERARLPFSDTHQAGIRRWLAENRADRYGRFHYSYDGFDVTADDIRSRFADYSARFGVGGA